MISAIKWLIVLIAAFYALPVTSQQNTVAGKSLCTFRGDASFSDSAVWVHAEYITDGFESQALVDSACPDAGTGIGFSEPTEKRSIEELERARRRYGMGTAHKRIIGDFFGVPRRRDSRLVFTIIKIRNLKVIRTHRGRFTGKERDTESGLDYFGARYYASSMGRFMSPGWSAKVEPVPYIKLDDPQTLDSILMHEITH